MNNKNPLDTLQTLEQLYRQGFRDSLTDAALFRVASSQATRDEAVLRDIERDLREFESQYNMSSEVFFKQWQAGQLPDSADFMDWNALVRMATEIRGRLEILRG
jgi:hypothetical protein